MSTIGSVASSAFDTTVNGLVRVPTLMVNITTVTHGAELTLRALSGVWCGLFGKPQEGTWTGDLASGLRSCGIRPYGQLDNRGEYKLKTSDLIIRTVVLAVIGALAFEFARFLCGEAPPIYNKVLTLLGPIRLDNTPYLDGFYSVLSL